MLYIFDTDIVSLWWKKQPKVMENILSKRDLGEYAITVVSRIELLEGRFGSIRTAANAEDLLRAVDRLSWTEKMLSQMRILPLDQKPAEIFETFTAKRKLKKPLRRMDLLIACIALAHDATLVTRNVKDYAPIPNLRVENWAD